MVVLVIIIFVLLGISDFPTLIQQKKWYEVSVLAGLYAFVFTLAILQTIGVILPSPVKGIQWFIINVLHLGYPTQ